jgi:integrase/recombinase XerD
MTDKPISPLRQRMIEDGTFRRLKLHAQRNHIRAMTTLAEHVKKSLDLIDYEEVRRYRLNLIAEGYKAHNVNQMMTGLRFFYKHTLGRRDALEMIPLPPEPPRKLREILTPQEIARLIASARRPMWRCLICVACGAGLRASEVVAKWLDKRDIKHIRGALFHPQTQGKIERWHQTMKSRFCSRTPICPASLNSASKPSLPTTTTHAPMKAC